MTTNQPTLFNDLCREFTERLQPKSNRFIKRLNLDFVETITSSTLLSDFPSIDEKLWALKSKNNVRPTCYCGEMTKFHKSSSTYHSFCSSSCARLNPETINERTQKRLKTDWVSKAQNTIIDRYGKEGIKLRRQEGVVKKYGVTNYFASDEFKHANREANLVKYGVTSFTQTPEYIQQYKKTCLERYGVEHYNKSDEFKALSDQRYKEASNRLFDKHGVEHSSQLKIAEVLPLISDYNWMYNQYIVQDKSTAQLVTELGVCPTTILNYLRKHEIEIKYNFGYSYRCIEWLTSIAESDNIHIQHALNGGEYKIPHTNYKADGYCKATNTIYEFHGDIWHGNPVLFNRDDRIPYSSHTAGYVYDATVKKENTIRELGYNLVVIWEHDWVNLHSNQSTRVAIDKQFVNDKLLTKHNRINNNALKKYQVDIEQVYQVMHNLTSPLKCKVCGTPTKLISFRKGYPEYCSVACATHCNRVSNSMHPVTESPAIQQLYNLLTQMGIVYTTHNKELVNGINIDIVIPKYNVGIKIVDVLRHSDKFVSDASYHQTSLIMAKNQGIQLMFITNDEIINKFNIIVNRLKNKLGQSKKTYARHCQLVEIDNATYQTYTEQYHVQGYARASVKLALTINGEIQAIMSFSKSRFNKNYEWELVRYTSLNTVIGGASKLLAYFKNKYKPKSIISYADLRWNTGDMYEKIGMNFLHTTKPNYWYVTEQGLVHRSSYQKHKLKKKLAIYDENKTEQENMQDNNFCKFWDCGNNAYGWQSDSKS